ncbi:MAG: endonuclease, partial [Variovorax sp.]
MPAHAQFQSTQQPGVTAAFTPGDALPLVLETIGGARSSILVAAYSFTSKPVAT